MTTADDYTPQSALEKSYFDSLWTMANISNAPELGGREAVTFFQRSSVDVGVLKQIWSLCTPVATMNPAQFFTALRYIAMFQSGEFPLSKEKMRATARIDLGYPKFSGVNPPPKPSKTVARRKSGDRAAAFSPSVSIPSPLGNLTDFRAKRSVSEHESAAALASISLDPLKPRDKALKVEPIIKVLKTQSWKDFFTQEPNEPLKPPSISVSIPASLSRSTEATEAAEPPSAHPSSRTPSHPPDVGSFAWNISRKKAASKDDMRSRVETVQKRLEMVFYRLVLRVEILWEKLKIPENDRIYYRKSLCKGPPESLTQCTDVAAYISILINHQNAVILVLKAINTRELHVKRCLDVIHAITRKLYDGDRGHSALTDPESTREKKALREFLSGMKHNNFWKEELLGVLTDVRASSQKVIQLIQAWRRNLWRPHPFMWRGVSYLSKMKEDMKILEHDVIRKLLQLVPIQLQDLLGVVFFKPEKYGLTRPRHRTERDSSGSYSASHLSRLGSPLSLTMKKQRQTEEKEQMKKTLSSDFGERTGSSSVFCTPTTTAAAATSAVERGRGEGGEGGTSSDEAYMLCLVDEFKLSIDFDETWVAAKVVTEEDMLQNALLEEQASLLMKGIFIPTLRVDADSLAKTDNDPESSAAVAIDDDDNENLKDTEFSSSPHSSTHSSSSAAAAAAGLDRRQGVDHRRVHHKTGSVISDIDKLPEGSEQAQANDLIDLKNYPTPFDKLDKQSTAGRVGAPTPSPPAPSHTTTSANSTVYNDENTTARAATAATAAAATTKARQAAKTAEIEADHAELLEYLDDRAHDYDDNQDVDENPATNGVDGEEEDTGSERSARILDAVLMVPESIARSRSSSPSSPGNHPPWQRIGSSRSAAQLSGGSPSAVERGGERAGNGSGSHGGGNREGNVDAEEVPDELDSPSKRSMSAEQEDDGVYSPPGFYSSPSSRRPASASALGKHSASARRHSLGDQSADYSTNYEEDFD